MASQRKSSVNMQSCWFLTSILFAVVLILPALSLDTLLCRFCPLQPKGKSCPPTTSQCLPDERCSSSKAHFGSVHILSAQGCMDRNLCGSVNVVSYRGMEYNVTHRCCCRDECNTRVKSETSLGNLLGIPGKAEETPNEDLQDSCANYTSTKTTISPDNKS